MNSLRTRHRQRGVSAWTLTGSLLIVAGTVGLGVALVKPSSHTASVAQVVTQTAASRQTDMGRTAARPAIGDKASEKIVPGESRHGWSLAGNGTLNFERQIVAKAGDPTAAELRISRGSQNGTHRYAVLVDTDRGPIEGYVWRKGAKEILARIPVYAVSDTMYWSPDGAHAVVTDGSRGEDHENVYIVNLHTSRVITRKVGPLKSGPCEVQRLDGLPASWGEDSIIRLTVRIEEDLVQSGVKCRKVKSRSMTVDVSLK